MKKLLVSAAAIATLVGCTSVEYTTVSTPEVAANGDAIAVVQANALGLSLLLHFVPLIQADLDTAVNKLLIGEAKAMGASRVDIKNANTLPTHGIYALYTCPFLILCPEASSAVGVAVK